MGWPFGGTKEDTATLLKQAAEAIVLFEREREKLSLEKDSMMRRQVEIWSVSTTDSSGGLDSEYKKAAGSVAFNVKRLLCLEEHVKKLRLAEFHAKNGNITPLKEVLTITDPCSNVQSDVPEVNFKPAPAPA
ncbi:MAG TPA: hypothetical protein VLA04_01085 [Verrucomicrobiae bacterium]|nr:hypothetical protein [Verrucomicrobiae bacterium]